MTLADALAGEEDRATGRDKGSVDVTPDGATINNVVVTSPINDDWTAVFALFNLDATKFEVVDETVRMSTWQQSKRTDDGSRDGVQLYAYSARFRRVDKEMIPAASIERWRRALQRTTPTAARKVSAGGTYLMLVADPQLGKKGTEEAVANWRRGVLGHLAEIRRLIASGVKVSGVHVAWQGDETEGVANNYGNQAHTIELNQSAQIELDFDLRVWTIKEVATLGLPISASSVISNHGEWTRNGSKEPVTSAGDNTSTHVARQVAKLFAELEQHGGPKVDWTIGGGDPAVVVRLSGVQCYFSHGYIEKGRGTSSETRTRAAIERQILGRTDALGKTPLWFFAHYHHSYSNEFEGRTVFGCPALEAERSSEYMLNQFGVWSPPGMLGMLIGGRAGRRWSHASVF